MPVEDNKKLTRTIIADLYGKEDEAFMRHVAFTQNIDLEHFDNELATYKSLVSGVPQAQKQKGEFTDILGGSGSRDLDISGVKLISDGTTAMGLIDGLKDTLSKSGGLGDKQGPIEGRIAEINKFDVKGQTKQAELKTAAQAVGTFLEGGKLAEGDVIKYERMLPSLSDDNQTALNKNEFVMDLLKQKMKNDLIGFSNANFDVSVQADDLDRRFSVNTETQENSSSSGAPESDQDPSQDIAKFNAHLTHAQNNPDDPKGQQFLEMVRTGRIDITTGKLVEQTEGEAPATALASTSLPGGGAEAIADEVPAEDDPSAFDKILDNADDRADNVGDILDDEELNLGVKAVGVFGQGLGLGADIIGQGASAVIPDFIEEPLAKGVGAAFGFVAESDAGQAVSEKYKKFAQDNPNGAVVATALGNLGLFATSFTGAGASKSIAQNTAKGASKVAGGTARGAEAVAKGGVSTASGLSFETVGQVIKNPGSFTRANIADFDRDSVAGEVIDTVQSRLDEMKGTGKEYQGVRDAKSPVVLSRDIYRETLEAEGFTVDANGKIGKSKDSPNLKSGDLKDLQDWYDQYGKETRFDSNSALNARQALADNRSFNKAATTNKDATGERIFGDMYTKFNDEVRPQIPGLDDLDARFKSEKRLLEDVQKKLFKPNGEIKDGAISTIANLNGRGKEKLLERFEAIRPGISKEINTLKAIEDITASQGTKVSTYFKGGLAAIAVSGGSYIGAIAGMAMTHPRVVVPLLRGYASARKVPEGLINGIENAWEKGIELTEQQRQFVDDAIKNASDKLDDAVKGGAKKASDFVKDQSRQTKSGFVRNPFSSDRAKAEFDEISKNIDTMKKRLDAEQDPAGKKSINEQIDQLVRQRNNIK